MRDQLRQGRRFDIVLSDARLPETNGHELARQIRAAELRAASTRRWQSR